MSSVPPPPPPPSSRPSRAKILLFGDSLTQTSFEGWASRLADAYQRRADVINRGMSGYNTRWYLRYANDSGLWDEVSPPDSVALIIILFGSNDAAIPTEQPHSHVPLDEYTSNLQTLIQLCHQHYPQAALLLMTPPPVHHEQRLAYQIKRYGTLATGRLERTLEYTGLYAQACREVAYKYQIPLVDLYMIMQQQPQPSSSSSSHLSWSDFFTDGLHFSKTGQEVVYHAIMTMTIQQQLPSLYVTPDPITGFFNNSGSSCPQLSSSGPYHDQIDHTQWEHAFEHHL